MSDSLPRFQPGDRVRVMQTPEMEARGLGGRGGEVLRVYEYRGGLQHCVVRLVGEFASMDFSNFVLMRGGK